jgi:hypothetical protein
MERCCKQINALVATAASAVPPGPALSVAEGAQPGGRCTFSYWIGQMGNQDLIRRFENDSVPEASFHHPDHVRLAFAYLTEYPVLEALEKFSNALKRFASARGKTQLYNETITCAYFFLIRERMARCEVASWEEFARRNPDLLVWKDGILSRYYRESTLKSDLARKAFILPDKCLESPTSLLEVARDQR